MDLVHGAREQPTGHTPGTVWAQSPHLAGVARAAEGVAVQTVANDLNMLVSTGGRQQSETEFRSLYADAGFRLTRIVATLATVSVIEGAPA